MSFPRRRSSTLRRVLPVFLPALVLAALGVLVLRWSEAKARTPISSLPNFVFFLVDDLGWADTALYGSDLHETPNIDRLARESLRFTNAYAAAPVCTPTRAALMTGKYPARLHMTIWREASRRPPLDRKVIPPVTLGDLPHEEFTLAEALQKVGYLTAHVGKWHLGTAPYYPQTHGFEYDIGGTLWGAPQTFFYPYRGSKHFGGEPRYVPHLEDGKPGEYLTDRLTDEALKVLDSAKGRPFFLYLAYHTVHTPIEGKPKMVERYRKKFRPEFRHHNAQYAAMVHSLDESVGRVLAKLDRMGVADNTVVVFTSDNGGYINTFEGAKVTNNYPLRSGKGSLYEGGIRVPAIVRRPGVTRPGSVSHEPIITTDFYPTLLGIVGLPGDAKHNATVDGVNLVPVLGNPKFKLNREALFFHYPHYYPMTTSPVSAVRAGDWKLLYFYEDERTELYHLKRDPGEREDLSEKNPRKAAELHKRLKAWLKSVDAQLPQPNSISK